MELWSPDPIVRNFVQFLQNFLNGCLQQPYFIETNLMLSEFQQAHHKPLPPLSKLSGFILWTLEDVTHSTTSKVKIRDYSYST